MSNTNTDVAIHEEAFVKSFVKKDYRERLSFELRKRRGDFLGRFSHQALEYLDPRFVIELPTPNSNRAEIRRELMDRGAANSCYAISLSDEIDRKMQPLDEALAIAVGFGLPSILSCLAGELAYLETEQEAGPPDRWILFRAPKKSS